MRCSPSESHGSVPLRRSMRLPQCFADPQSWFFRYWLCFAFASISLLISILGFFPNMIVFAFFVTGVECF
jgi:hypothetical protein